MAVNHKNVSLSLKPGGFTTQAAPNGTVAVAASNAGKFFARRKYIFSVVPLFPFPSHSRINVYYLCGIVCVGEKSTNAVLTTVPVHSNVGNLVNHSFVVTQPSSGQMLISTTSPHLSPNVSIIARIRAPIISAKS